MTGSIIPLTVHFPLRGDLLQEPAHQEFEKELLRILFYRLFLSQMILQMGRQQELGNQQWPLHFYEPRRLEE